MTISDEDGRMFPRSKRRQDYSLRLLEEADLDKVLEWRNSERIRSNMYTDQIISPGEHKEWFHQLRERKKDVYLVFEYLSKPVGMVYFTDIDKKNMRCNWGFYLGEIDVPRGMGSAMGVLGLEYAFEILNIRKLCGEAFSFNEASIKFFSRLGFLEEGFFKKHVMKNGKYQDVAFFALFRDDWQKNRKKQEEDLFS